MKIQNLSVATKLWAIVLGLIGAMLAVGVWLTLHVTSVDDAAAAKIQSAQGRITDATRWRGLTELGVERAVLSVIVSDDALSKRLHADRVAASEAVNVLQKQVFAAAQSDADKAQLERIGAERKVLLDAIARTQEMRAAGDNAGAMRHTDQNLRPAAAAYLAAQDAFVKLQVAARDDAVREAREDRASALALGAVLAAFVALLACLLAGIVVRSVLMPLRQAMQLTDRIAQGDLSVSVEESRKDELGHLLRSLSNMAEHLRGIVRDVRAGVAAVGAASTQIAAGNQNLASRTEQTAANLEETAASMEQLTATVTQSADTASEAYRLAASAADAAGRGGEVVGGVVNSMRQISEHSSRISDIIGVIDSIAFQTNILALNAAVEAARAGEQGRGFAVVAGEVRTLAQRSAEASKEIRQLIGASSERVAAGAAQVEEAGRSMSDIVAGVRRVADLIGEISAAAGEQRDGIGQVNLAVTHLDQMTQQNAALVEASNASAAALLEQARQLETSVAVFRTEVSDVRGLGARQPAAPIHVVLPMHPQLAGS